MSLGRVDLNLLVYLDVLLRERNVTRAASVLGISQPAMSNGLRRLRDLFGDPLLVRTSEGMVPTERARELEPVLRVVLSTVDRAIRPRLDFSPAHSNRNFRIMASDYCESTLIPSLLNRLREFAPAVTLDILSPSDVSYVDVEQGKVDMVINRFDDMPQSFHQVTLWKDTYACLLSVDNPICDNFTLASYLAADHVWVSKSGMGISFGVSPEQSQQLGRVDNALALLGHRRNIKIFTRHYQAAMLLAEQKNLVVTVPAKAALLHKNNPAVVTRTPPFVIPPMELQMAWSPLMHNNPDHRWLRRLIIDIATELSA